MSMTPSAGLIAKMHVNVRDLPEFYSSDVNKDSMSLADDVV